MSVTVVDRHGHESKIDIEKIRKVVRDCSVGLTIDHLEVEAHIDAFSKSEVVTTSEIQKSIIHYAVTKCDLNNLDYSSFAARMLLHEVTKEAKRNLKFDQYTVDGFVSFVNKMVEENQYDKVILERYNEESIREIFNSMDFDNDALFEYAGLNILKNRYLIGYELPQTMFMVVSMYLAMNEKPEVRNSVTIQFYSMITRKLISLATPILTNLRRPNGNLSSCFIVAMDDNLDSIFQTVKDISNISATGGGVGVNVSRIRSNGSYLRGQLGGSNGVLPWIKIVNDTMIAVDQNGHRAGAATVALDIWHNDIIEFLEMQTENGDLRRKSFDVFPQVVISDIFMRRVEESGPWTTFDPYEIKKVFGINIFELHGKAFEDWYLTIEHSELIKFKRVHQARDIMKHIMKTQIETGMPYIFFKDTANKYNPNKECGYIGSANLCVESFSNFRPSSIMESEHDSAVSTEIRRIGETHICNLVSINLAEIDITDEDEIKQIHRTAVRILDNAIEITTPPVMDADNHNRLYRVIGIGYMGLHDLLAINDKRYAESGEFVDNLFEKFAYYTYDSSIDLAKERGTFEAYENSEFYKGKILNKTIDEYSNSSMYEKWKVLFNKLKVFGIRNSQCTAIAPNTSTSNLIGCTASVLPTYSKFHIEKNSNGNVPVFPPYIRSKRWFYNENKFTDQRDVIRITSIIQKWIDTGISMELVYNLNSDITAKDIFENIIFAWKSECKAIYYTRTIQKDGSEKSKEECVSCAN